MAETTAAAEVLGNAGPTQTTRWQATRAGGDKGRGCESPGHQSPAPHARVCVSQSVRASGLGMHRGRGGVVECDTQKNELKVAHVLENIRTRCHRLAERERDIRPKTGHNR